MRRSPSYRTDARGVVLILDVARYRLAHPGADVARCGACGRAWDGAVATAWTPAPSGRCPYEDRHGEPRHRPAEPRERDGWHRYPHDLDDRGRFREDLDAVARLVGGTCYEWRAVGRRCWVRRLP